MHCIPKKFHISRTEREISVRAIPRENVNYDAKKIQEAKHEKDDGDLKDTYLRRKREVARSSSIGNDFQRSNVEKSVDDNAASHPRGSDEKSDYEEQADEETSDLVRLPRDASLKYTDQDERSSLYDDYEVKDVAKRGAEDYEEVDSPGLAEDMAAVREEESNEAERRETRGDARVKRDQAIPESLDDSSLESDGAASELRLDPESPEETKTAADGSYSHEVSNIDSSRGIDEPSIFNDNVPGKLAASNSGASDSSAEYEKRVEERIQRKIDSIKDEIRRDIEAQRRIRDIQENNAKFDELQDEESFESDSIEKSSTKKRSARDVDAVVSSKSGDKKRSPKAKQRKKAQRRSGKSDNNSSERRSSRDNPKRQSTANRDESSGQSPSKGLFKKKRERIRETILVKNDRHRAKKRSSRASERSDGKLGNELSAGQNLNSYLRANDEMVRLSGDCETGYPFPREAPP